MELEIKVCDTCLEEGRLRVAVAESDDRDVCTHHLIWIRRMGLDYVCYAKGEGDLDWPVDKKPKK